MMKLLVGNDDISRRVLSKVGTSKMVLFKYGHGSGGDLLLKQLFDRVQDGTYSVMISTHQTEGEMSRDLTDMGIERPPELVSLVPFIDKRLDEVVKQDRFISEGIMVTDLLEISSYSEDGKMSKRPHLEILSTLTNISSRQILPFRMVLDSLADLIEETSFEDIVDRLRILKRSLKEKGGIIVVGCPLCLDVQANLELTLFDAVIEVKAEKRGDTWFRTLAFSHVKGSGDPPEEWQISVVKDIPTALEVD